MAKSKAGEPEKLDPDSRTDGRSFFSISFDLVITRRRLPYDLYINSSVIEDRERYIRIFPRKGVLEDDDIANFRRKYRMLYVPETQRGLYLKSLCVLEGKAETEKATVLKDSAIRYLGSLYDHTHEFSTDVFNTAISGCRDVVEGLVDVLQGYNVDQLQELIANLSFHD